MTTQTVVRPRRDRRIRSAKPVVDNNHDKSSNGNGKTPDVPPENEDVAYSGEEKRAQSAPKPIKDILRNPILLPSEVATLLRLDVGAVKTLAREGDLPSMKIGRHMRFLRRDVLAHLHALRSQRLFAEDLRRKQGS